MAKRLNKFVGALEEGTIKENIKLGIDTATGVLGTGVAIAGAAAGDALSTTTGAAIGLYGFGSAIEEIEKRMKDPKKREFLEAKQDRKKNVDKFEDSVTDLHNVLDETNEMLKEIEKEVRKMRIEQQGENPKELPAGNQEPVKKEKEREL